MFLREKAAEPVAPGLPRPHRAAPSEACGDLPAEAHPAGATLVLRRGRTKQGHGVTSSAGGPLETLGKAGSGLARSPKLPRACADGTGLFEAEAREAEEDGLSLKLLPRGRWSEAEQRRQARGSMAAV